jgi:hypothetical protein
VEKGRKRAGVKLGRKREIGAWSGERKEKSRSEVRKEKGNGSRSGERKEKSRREVRKEKETWRADMK